MKGIVIGLLLALITVPAQASRHPQEAQPKFIDVAAVPTYAPDIAPVGHHFYARRHAQRHHIERHASAHRRTPDRVQPGLPVTAPAPSQFALPLPDAVRASALGALLELPAGWADGLATTLPLLVRTPPRIAGTIEIAGELFHYGSGGFGYSIPYGDYPITGGDGVGSWGSRHGAIGIAGGEIWDKRLGRYREGIELHGARNARLATEGCVAIDEWGRFKKMLLAMLNQGRAFLHIGPSGARVSPNAEPMFMVADARVEIERPHVERHHRRYAEHRHRRVHYAAR